jgi:hypothetical protein
VKKTNSKKSDPKAAKLIDELVKKDVETLRVKTQINAGGPQKCCVNCDIITIRP